MMPIEHILILFASGLIGGVAAGLFGIGGGIIYVLAYNIFLGRISGGVIPETAIVQLTILNAACSIWFAAIIGSYRQYVHGNFYPGKVMALGLTSALSSFATTWIISGWPGYNQRIFLIIFTFAMIPLILKFLPGPARKVKEELPLAAFPATGLFAGAGSALSGLGGGFISNPVLHGFLKYPLKKTFSISLGSMIFTSSGIILYHILFSSEAFKELPLPNFNGIIFPLILPVFAGVLIGTPFGIRLHNKFTAKSLSISFFVLAVAIAVRNVVVIFGGE